MKRTPRQVLNFLDGRPEKVWFAPSFLSLLFVITIILPPPAFAVDIPKAAEIERAIAAPPAAPEEKPALEMDEEKKEEAGVVPGAEDIRFLLKSIDLQGVQAYTPEELESLYQDKLNTEVSLADVVRVAHAITAKYRSDGYMLSQAIVPAQEVEDGDVVINVLEGFVDRVLVNVSDSAANSKMLQGYFKAISSARPLTMKALEQNLLAINSMAGTSVKTTLKASPKTLGAADLFVNLSHQLFSAYAILDNRGSQLIGPERLTLGFNLNSILHRSEKISGTWTSTRILPFITDDRYDNWSVTYAEKLGSLGVDWHAKIGLALASPAEKASLSGLDVESETRTIELGLTYPLIRSRSKTLTLSYKFDYRDSRTDLNDAIYSEDRVPAMEWKGDLAFLDPWRGATSVSVALKKGLTIFDATSEDSVFRTRDNGQVDFWKTNVDVSRTQWLGINHSFSVSTTMQFANRELLSGDEFFLGGSSYLSAYDSGALSGDNGAAIRTQLVRKKLAPIKFLESIGAYAFYDYGFIRDRQNEHTVAWSSIESAGGGLNIDLPLNAQLDLELAFPLTRRVDIDSELSDAPRVFFSFVWKT